MLLTKNNLSDSNIEKAFNTNGGFSFEDDAEVRDAVNNKARNIVAELHAKKLGVSLEEFHSNKDHYVKMLENGYGN